MSVVSGPNADRLLVEQGYQPEDAFETLEDAEETARHLVRQGYFTKYKILNEGKGVRLRYTIYGKGGATSYNRPRNPGAPGFLQW